MSNIPTPKYKIGDVVYSARRLRLIKTKQCPDCLGQLKWTVTAPSGETWECQCGTCLRGWASTGKVEFWEVDGLIEPLTIGSVRIDTAASPGEIIEYMCVETGVGSGTVWREARLHATREEAEAWCAAEAQREVDEENARILKRASEEKKKPRHKPTRTKS